MTANTTSTTSTPRRALRTTDAAKYLGISPSLMRKMRSRGPDDPLGPGPAYIRLSLRAAACPGVRIVRRLSSQNGERREDTTPHSALDQLPPTRKHELANTITRAPFRAIN
jgi:hypothetical protein